MSIEINNLKYTYPNQTIGLDNLSLTLPKGTRTLLIGANGAGKSTLLKLLAGKNIGNEGAISVNGNDPFRKSIENSTYLGTEWIMNPIVRNDIKVDELIISMGGNEFKQRRDELVELLDVDINWHMNSVSDGERRRVQLVMGLLRPWNFLFLDEVTVDLDVLVRYKLLEFLKRESLSRNATIVYATHIFDGMADWPTYLVHLHLGTVQHFGPADEFLINEENILNKNNSSICKYNSNSTLLMLALEWLREDYKHRESQTKRAKFV